MEEVGWKGEKAEESGRAGAREGGQTQSALGSRTSGLAKVPKRMAATSLRQSGHADEITAMGRSRHTPKAHTQDHTWQGVRTPGLSLCVT